MYKSKPDQFNSNGDNDNERTCMSNRQHIKIKQPPPPLRLKGTEIKEEIYEIIKKSFLINLLNKYSYLLYIFLFKPNFCLFITFLFYHSLKCIGCILIIFYKHPCTVFLNSV